jgi:hypothetical protein
VYRIKNGQESGRSENRMSRKEAAQIKGQACERLYRLKG